MGDCSKCFPFLQLFDVDNPINKDASQWIFSTEGHIFKLDQKYRGKYDFDFFDYPEEERASDDDVLNVHQSANQTEVWKEGLIY